jgi:primosomal protein N' (replication factor Y)
MVQVAGRAGRAEKEGVIYLQTFHTDHPAIQAAAGHDTETFWKRELELRKALNYPPFSKLALMVYRSLEEKKAQAAAEAAAKILRRGSEKLAVEVYGPAPAGIAKLRGQYRYQILMKAQKPQAIRQLIQWLDDQGLVHPGVARSVDIDPQSML